MKAELKEQVEARLDELLVLIWETLPDFPRPTIGYDHFNLFSYAAAAANAVDWDIQISPEMLEAYPEEMLAEGLPHELGHLVSNYKNKNKFEFELENILLNGHGPLWEEVMHDIFGIENPHDSFNSVVKENGHAPINP